MNEFKFQFVNVLLLGVLVFGMYWAFTNINNGITYGDRDIIAAPGDVIEDPVIDEDIFDTPVIIDDISYEVPQKATSEKKLSTEEKELQSKLEALVKDNINMKQGSRGTRVETVQKFLNIYFDTSSVADGDYGPGTLANVKKFQKAEGLTADGQAGPNTYKKMIEVLDA